MERNLIAETSLEGLRPRGVRGRLAIDSWEQVATYLTQKMGPEYGNLFAQPVQGRQGIFWYGPASGDAAPLADLPQAEQEAVKARLAERLDRIRDHAAELRTARDPAAQQLGAMLETAMEVPGGEMDRDVIHAVDGEPVLVSWGISDDRPGPPRQYLHEFLKTAPPPPEPAPPSTPEPPPVAGIAGNAAALVVEERPSPWWNLLWIVLSLLLAAIWYVLLEGCGLLGGGRFLNYCPFEEAAAREDPGERTDDLRRELARLEGRMRPLPMCETGRRPFAAPALSTPQAAPAEPPPEDDFSERLRQQGGEENCDISVTLKWDTPSDLDLHLVCPDEQINFRSQSACGGELDVDANREESAIMAAPVENICIAHGNSRPGRYQIFVHNYRKRSPDSVAKDSFQLRVRRNGETETFGGELGQNENSLVTTIVVE